MAIIDHKFCLHQQVRVTRDTCSLEHSHPTPVRIGQLGTIVFVFCSRPTVQVAIGRNQSVYLNEEDLEAT